MSGRIVTAALVATALGVGVVVGLAAPRSQQTDDASATPDAHAEQLAADLARRDEWVAAVADAAAAGRLEGMRVALLITDGTSAEAVDQVKASLEGGGATVAATGNLGADWWDPTKSSFRGELATQMSASIAGIDGLGATDVLQHAIVQAIVPGAAPGAPPGTVASPTPSPSDTDTGVQEGASNQEVLLEVLKRAKILTLDHPATDGIDALVIVTAEGPQGAGDALSAAATVWERYVGATQIVVAGDKGTAGTAGTATPAANPKTASDAIQAVADAPAATRPSVVVLSDAKLAAVQIVMALKEQAAGGSGTYGTAAGLDIVAIP